MRQAGLADKHSLRSSCVPTPSFESARLLQKYKRPKLSLQASYFCGPAHAHVRAPLYPDLKNLLSSIAGNDMSTDDAEHLAA